MFLTLEESIFYVYKRLGNYWEETRDEELGLLLSEINPVYIPGYIPGTQTVATADPAAWYDWVEAVYKLMSYSPSAEQSLIVAKQAHHDWLEGCEKDNELFRNTQITQEESIKSVRARNDGPFWAHWVEVMRKTIPDGRITETQSKKAIVLLMQEYNKQGFKLNPIIENIETIFKLYISIVSKSES